MKKPIPHPVFYSYSRLVQFFVVLFRNSLLLTLSPAAVRTCSVKAWISRMPNAKQRAKRKGTSWPSDLRIVHRALVIKDAEMFFLSWAFQQDPFTDLCCIRGSWLLSSIIICWKNDFVKQFWHTVGFVSVTIWEFRVWTKKTFWMAISN